MDKEANEKDSAVKIDLEYLEERLFDTLIVGSDISDEDDIGFDDEDEAPYG